MFRAQADWTVILPSELPEKQLRRFHGKCRRRLIRLLNTYVVPRGGIFLGKWRTLSQEVPTVK
jgi:hypothetical protein